MKGLGAFEPGGRCAPLTARRATSRERSEHPSRAGGAPHAGAARTSRAAGAHVLYWAAMKRGQTTVEYLLVMVLLMSAALLAGWLVRAVNTQHARTQLLLGSDYP